MESMVVYFVGGEAFPSRRKAEEEQALLRAIGYSADETQITEVTLGERRELKC